MTDQTTVATSNFSFLAAHELLLVKLGGQAERYFAEDPNTSLIKLRQYAELLAQKVALSLGISFTSSDDFVNVLNFLRNRGIAKQVLDLFHGLRKTGNKAVHGGDGTHADALHQLKMARVLGEWYVRLITKDHSFNAPAFVPPPDPRDATKELSEQLAALRTKLEETESSARAHAEEAAVWQQKAKESEEQLEKEVGRFTEEIAKLSQTQRPEPAVAEATLQQANEAGKHLNLDEADTRKIIDEQLRNCGWEADSKVLRYSAGTRPVKGRNMAIAEWPTDSGPADYAFFVGMKCIATTEAKRRNKNVSTAIGQAERYAKDFSFAGGAESVGGPWAEYKVPFVFSANGRPYLKQVETQSGIWFRDTRKGTNLRRALVDWLTPDGLTALLDMDKDKAHENLKHQSFDFGFPLRPYQRKAIEAVETALEQDRREMLLAMATGTGKTKLAIAMLYRLLSAKRFRRVCFVVDRSALGEQAAGEFKTTKVVSVRTFADTFGLKELTDVKPDTETKVHICTIQGLVKRLLYASDPSDVPPVDQYDLIVVDECHRGYLLDRELSDAELEFRSQEDYISKYRRVLEHFDAVKIGLTATPAIHTAEIFGDPIYTYSYRDAVVDGFLIDHEPPIQIKTELSQNSIKFEQGEDVQVLNTATGAVDLVHTDDELKFDVEDFNRKVITVEFNKAVAEALTQYIDPSLPGKTLVFAVNDGHADIVVDQIKKVFAEAFGEIDDAAVRKITGSVDRVREVILSYRNDSLPKIAVTVDLLTTGVDVPSIVNLVFLRRVNSRILYEQMLGRATRRCDEIGKETFRIFDAVDLYRTLQSVSTMKPVVVNPMITFEQLFEELQKVSEEEHRDTIIEQLIVKLRRRVKGLAEQVEASYRAEAGEAPADTLARLQKLTKAEAAEWLRQRPKLGPILDWNPDKGIGYWLPISNHADRVMEVTRGYGTGAKPEDFLESFTAFIRNNINEIAALKVVVQRPRELTRAQLREIKLALDKQGYSEANLRRAWQDTKNEDIAASIIGFVRQAALGDPLVPYEGRVRAAMDRIMKKHAWSDIQKKWLKRIGEQLAKEVVVDREYIDSGQFKIDAGGFDRLNKVFTGQLETLLGDLNEEVWRTGT